MPRAQEESQRWDLEEFSMPMFCDFEEEDPIKEREKKQRNKRITGIF